MRRGPYAPPRAGPRLRTSPTNPLYPVPLVPRPCLTLPRVVPRATGPHNAALSGSPPPWLPPTPHLHAPLPPSTAASRAPSRLPPPVLLGVFASPPPPARPPLRSPRIRPCPVACGAPGPPPVWCPTPAFLAQCVRSHVACVSSPLVVPCPPTLLYLFPPPYPPLSPPHPNHSLLFCASLRLAPARGPLCCLTPLAPLSSYCGPPLPT